MLFVLNLQDIEAAKDEDGMLCSSVSLMLCSSSSYQACLHFED
jgi:hypothetical protein